ncbi:MAG: hypothetical protein QOG83_2194 [Alphaproteobacteria bacterium]|nr:hypothetical protein [Alphaproteobacteria bacterium]
MTRGPTAARRASETSTIMTLRAQAAFSGLHSAEVHAMFAPMRKHILRTVLLLLAGAPLASSPALAHPHVWVTMKSELVYNPDGSVKAVRHAWVFDDMFSVFATQGLENKTKGIFTREELQPLADTNVESLKEFDYFTYATANGKKVEFSEPLKDHHGQFDAQESVLTLHFTLPFKTPVQAKDLVIEIYDPSYFVDFAFTEKNPAVLVGAPAGCKLTVARPAEMDAATQQRLFQMGPDEKLDSSAYISSQFASKLVVKCP